MPVYPCVNVRFSWSPISQRPHPGCPRRRSGSPKNAPDDETVSIDDVIIVIILNAGAARGPNPSSNARVWARLCTARPGGLRERNPLLPDGAHFVPGKQTLIFDVCNATG